MWSHKALLSRRHTPVGRSSESRQQRTTGSIFGRKFVPAPGAASPGGAIVRPIGGTIDRGRRLDHMWVSPELAGRLKAHEVLEPCRNWEWRSRPRPPDLRNRGLTASPVRAAIAALFAPGARSASRGPAAVAILSIETATPECSTSSFRHRAGDATDQRWRAGALNLADDRDATDPGRTRRPARAPWPYAAAALAIADPGRDLERAPRGRCSPYGCQQRGSRRALATSLASAGRRTAVRLDEPGDRPGLHPRRESTDSARPPVEVVTRARVPARRPAADADRFRSALPTMGKIMSPCWSGPSEQNAARAASQRVSYGDVFGSLKCDCGGTLRTRCTLSGTRVAACCFTCVRRSHRAGEQDPCLCAAGPRPRHGGRQPCRLGFGDDERDYGHAVAMLRALAISPRCGLLTNNPRKVGLGASY